MVRIAVLDDYAGVAGGADWDSITGAEVVFFHDHVTDPDALVARLRDFDVVQMVRERTPLPQSVLEALPRLRLLSGTGRRQPHVDIGTADRLGIPVTGTGGPSDPFSSSIGGDSTLELTWGLILALTRHISWEDRQIRRGDGRRGWERAWAARRSASWAWAASGRRWPQSLRHSACP